MPEANKYQKKIINWRGGPAVVDAGAGSGKTFTIIKLVAELIDNGVDPNRILLVTFTRDAAKEMKMRLINELSLDLPDFKIGIIVGDDDNGKKEMLSDGGIEAFLYNNVTTIHATCFRLLKKYGKKCRFPSTKQTWEIDDIIKDGIALYELDADPKTIKRGIGIAINNLIKSHEAMSFFEGFVMRQKDAASIANIYIDYLSYLRGRNLVDFDMMQADILELIRTDPSFKGWISSLYDYVIVDEAQDTSYLQSEILFTLASRTRNILYVGDVWQSMYRWRGAHPSIMEEDFGKFWGLSKNDYERFELPINYRSTKQVVRSSNKLIKNNYIGREEFLKEMQPRDNADDGEPPTFEVFDFFEEVIDAIEIEIEATNSNPGDWFFLSRTRAECGMAHMEFLKRGIPAINMSGGLLLGSPHIQRVLAYMMLAIDYNDARKNKEILKTIANCSSSWYKSPINKKDANGNIVMEKGVDVSPVRYYGAKYVEQAGDYAGIVDQSKWTTKRGAPAFQSYGATDIVEFVTACEERKDNAFQLAEFIIYESVLPHLKHTRGIGDDDLGENGIAEDFEVITSMIEMDETPEEFLDRMNKFQQSAGDVLKSDAIVISTIHGIKGLERPYVAYNVTRSPISGIVRKGISFSSGINPEEERCIAYVASTRSKIRTYYYQSLNWNGKPVPESRFPYEAGVVEEGNC